MHAKPDVAAESIGVLREHFDGQIGVYAESGDWAAPNWVFNGLSPDEYMREVDSWVGHGAQIIGGCCGVGPEHILVLADRLASRYSTTKSASAPYPSHSPVTAALARPRRPSAGPLGQ